MAAEDKSGARAEAADRYGQGKKGEESFLERRGGSLGGLRVGGAGFKRQHLNVADSNAWQCGRTHRILDGMQVFHIKLRRREVPRERRWCGSMHATMWQGVSG